MELGRAVVVGLLQLCGLLGSLRVRERRLVARGCSCGHVVRLLRARDRGVRVGQLLLVGGQLCGVVLLLLLRLPNCQSRARRVLFSHGVGRRETLFRGGDLLRRLLDCNLVLLLLLRRQPCLELSQVRLRGGEIRLRSLDLALGVRRVLCREDLAAGHLLSLLNRDRREHAAVLEVDVQLLGSLHVPRRGNRGKHHTLARAGRAGRRRRGRRVRADQEVRTDSAGRDDDNEHQVEPEPTPALAAAHWLVPLRSGWQAFCASLYFADVVSVGVPEPAPGRTTPRLLIHRENAANDPLPPAPAICGPRRPAAWSAAGLHRILQLLPIGVALRGARREVLDAVLLQARPKLCELGTRLAVLARPAEALALRPQASARLHRLLQRSRVDILRRPTLGTAARIESLDAILFQTFSEGRPRTVRGRRPRRAGRARRARRV